MYKGMEKTLRIIYAVFTTPYWTADQTAPGSLQPSGNCHDLGCPGSRKQHKFIDRSLVRALGVIFFSTSEALSFLPEKRQVGSEIWHGLLSNIFSWDGF